MAHVTIPDQDTHVSYPITSSTTGPFNIPFAIFAKADLVCLIDGVDIGQGAFSYTPTSTTTGGYQTGQITLGSARANCTLTIYRRILPVRTSDMGPGPKDRDADNTQWDRFQAQLQDARRDLDGALRLAVGETAEPIELGSPGEVLGLDADGNPAFLLPTVPLAHDSWRAALLAQLGPGWALALGVNGRTIYLDASESLIVNDAVIIQARIDLLAALGGGTLVLSGTFICSTTIVWKKGVTVRSAGGFGQSIIYVTADFGDTSRAGVNTVANTAQGQEIDGIWFWRDYGTYTPGVTTTLQNRCTLNPNAAHLRIYNAQSVVVRNCWFYGEPYGIYWDGGSNPVVENCFFSQQFYDPTLSGLQEGKASIYFGLSTLNGGFPTQAVVRGCWLGGGGFSAARTINFGGGTSNVAVDHVNIGPQYGIHATAFEILDIVDNYLGGQSTHNIFIQRTGTIGTGLTITGNYLDSAGQDSQINIDSGANDSYIAHSVISCNGFYGTGLTKNAIRVGLAPAIGPMSIGLLIANNHFRDHVGCPVKLIGARGTTLEGNLYHNYNFYNLSASSPDFCAGIYVTGGPTNGASTVLTATGETFGSGGIFENGPGSASNYLVYGIYTADLTGDASIKLNPDTHNWRGKTTGSLLAGTVTDGYKQPLSVNLTAEAALTGAADKLSYYTSSSAKALADLTPFARTILDDANAAAVIATLGLGVFSNYTPTVTSTSGTITTVGTVACRYMQIGKLVVALYGINITTNGTGGTAVRATLPATAAGLALGIGREDNVIGQALQVENESTTNSTAVLIRDDDDNYPGGDGRYLKFVVIYEAA